MSARPLRVGMVGLGRIFDLNCLGYLENPEATIVAMCDTRADLLEKRQSLLPNAFATTDYRSMLARDLDLVEVLTPHPLHEPMAIAALEAGSHVSVQKPMAMSLAECDRMVEAATRTGRQLKLFENFVFYPPLQRAHALLQSGAIGEPTHFRMKVVVGDHRGAWDVPTETNAWRYALGEAGQGGPIVFDHGHHMMAVALWLFGDVADCFGRIDTTRVPDGPLLDAPATLTWRHRARRLHAVWDVSLALEMRVRTDYYASHEQFEIQGEAGIIEVRRCSDRLLDEPVLTLYRDGEVRAWHDLDDDWGASFRRSTLHFIDVLRGRAPEAVLTAAQGRRVVELFQMLDRSSREGRVIRHPDLDDTDHV